MKKIKKKLIKRIPKARPQDIRQKSDVSQTLSLALEFHKLGQLAQAEKNYRQVLVADPNNILANNYLGLIESK